MNTAPAIRKTFDCNAWILVQIRSGYVLCLHIFQQITVTVMFGLFLYSLVTLFRQYNIHNDTHYRFSNWLA